MDRVRIAAGKLVEVPTGSEFDFCKELGVRMRTYEYHPDPEEEREEVSEELGGEA